MQFNVLALALATMASVAAAGETVTVYACESTPAVAPVPATSGVASPTVAPTGGVSPPTPTGSPIPYQGAASVKGVSALGMIIAGGVALFI